jgi:hypothetical protein
MSIARDLVEGRQPIMEFTGAASMGTVEGPAPGIAAKPKLTSRRPPLDRKRRRRAVSALLGESDGEDDQNTPEPVEAAPPPAPSVSLTTPPAETPPAWAVEMMTRLGNIENRLGVGAPPTPPSPPTSEPAKPPVPKAPPSSPPVEPSDVGRNVPPRTAAAASANVSDSVKPSVDAAASRLLQETGLAASGADLLRPGVPMPPPDTENRSFRRA